MLCTLVCEGKQIPEYYLFQPEQQLEICTDIATRGEQHWHLMADCRAEDPSPLWDAQNKPFRHVTIYVGEGGPPFTWEQPGMSIPHWTRRDSRAQGH